MEPEEYQQIEQYLNNELSETELRAFEERLSTDPQFAAEVSTYTDITASLQAKADREAGENELRQTLDKVSQEYGVENKKPAGRVVPLNRVYWAAAACALLLISFLFIINQPSTPTYAEYAHYDPLVLTSRNENTSDLRALAEEAFNNEHYNAASEHLEQLVASNPDDITAQLYLALSLIETNSYSKSDSLLNNIAQGSSVYTDMAIWYQALSHLKRNNMEASKKLLKEIPEGAVKYEEAQDLLESL